MVYLTFARRFAEIGCFDAVVKEIARAREAYNDALILLNQLTGASADEKAAIEHTISLLETGINILLETRVAT